MTRENLFQLGSEGNVTWKITKMQCLDFEDGRSELRTRKCGKRLADEKKEEVILRDCRKKCSPGSKHLDFSPMRFMSDFSPTEL